MKEKLIKFQELRILEFKKTIGIKGMFFYPREHKVLLEKKRKEYNLKFKTDFCISFDEIKVKESQHIEKVEFNITRISENISEEELIFFMKIEENKNLIKSGRMKALLKKIIGFNSRPLKRFNSINKRARLIELFNNLYSSNFFIKNIREPDGSYISKIFGDSDGPEISFL